MHRREVHKDHAIGVGIRQRRGYGRRYRQASLTDSAVPTSVSSRVEPLRGSSSVRSSATSFSRPIRAVGGTGRFTDLDDGLPVGGGADAESVG